MHKFEDMINEVDRVELVVTLKYVLRLQFVDRLDYVLFVTLLFLTLITFAPTQASADIGGLTKCSESPAFNKRLTTSVKKLEQRMSKYEADSPPALALKQQIERVQVRFDKYSRSDLLCGKDGLPHLIADGRWSHAAEFIVPGIGFIYISGWIGWVGRKYLFIISKF